MAWFSYPEPIAFVQVDAGRLLTIAGIAVLVTGVEWRLVEPSVIANDPERMAIPWAMLAISFPIALGAWAFESNNPHVSRGQVTFLWGVMLGTVVYALIALASR